MYSYLVAKMICPMSHMLKQFYTDLYFQKKKKKNAKDKVIIAD